MEASLPAKNHRGQIFPPRRGLPRDAIHAIPSAGWQAAAEALAGGEKRSSLWAERNLGLPSLYQGNQLDTWGYRGNQGYGRIAPTKFDREMGAREFLLVRLSSHEATRWLATHSPSESRIFWPLPAWTTTAPQKWSLCYVSGRCKGTQQGENKFGVVLWVDHV